MDTFEAISSRRAIKKFDSNYKMTSEQVDSLMKLVILFRIKMPVVSWLVI